MDFTKSEKALLKTFGKNGRLVAKVCEIGFLASVCLAIGTAFMSGEWSKALHSSMLGLLIVLLLTTLYHAQGIIIKLNQRIVELEGKQPWPWSVDVL